MKRHFTERIRSIHSFHYRLSNWLDWRRIGVSLCFVSILGRFWHTLIKIIHFNARILGDKSNLYVSFHLSLYCVYLFTQKMVCTRNNSILLPDMFVEFILKPLETIMLIQFQPAVATIGSLFNLTFLFVVFKSKEMHTITNVYLSNLAVADTTFMVYNCVISVIEYLWSPLRNDRTFYRNGVVGCSAEQLVNYTMYYASLFLVAVVTFERYLAICHPLSHRRIASRSRTRKLSAGCWFIALLLGLFMVFIKGNYVEDCQEYSPKYSHLPQVVGGCTSFNTSTALHWYLWRAHYIIECGTFLIIFIGKTFYWKYDQISDLIFIPTLKSSWPTEWPTQHFP